MPPPPAHTDLPTHPTLPHHTLLCILLLSTTGAAAGAEAGAEGEARQGRQGAAGGQRAQQAGEEAGAAAAHRDPGAGGLLWLVVGLIDWVYWLKVQTAAECLASCRAGGAAALATFQQAS